MAAQLILIRGCSLRTDCECSALATSSLPVPDSPVMSTVEGVSATRSMMLKISCMAAPVPMRPNRPFSVSSAGKARARPVAAS